MLRCKFMQIGQAVAKYCAYVFVFIKCLPPLTAWKIKQQSHKNVKGKHTYSSIHRRDVFPPDAFKLAAGLTVSLDINIMGDLQPSRASGVKASYYSVSIDIDSTTNLHSLIVWSPGSRHKPSVYLGIPFRDSIKYVPLLELDHHERRKMKPAPTYK